MPVENLLGKEGHGFKMLMEKLQQERLTICIGSMASCRRSLEDTLAYVKERKAFGTTIGSFQNTRFTLADVKTEIAINRAFYEKCADAYTRGEMTSEDAAILKLASCEMQCKVVDDCLQLFGGYGYTVEYPISRFYTDARIQRIYGGTSEIMRDLVARTMLGKA